MLRHIVCWKLKGTAEEQERVVCRFREMMDDLQKILPEILSCSIGVNRHEGEEAFDLCVDETFADQPTLEYYLYYPDHVAIRDYMSASSYIRWCSISSTNPTRQKQKREPGVCIRPAPFS